MFKISISKHSLFYVIVIIVSVLFSNFKIYKIVAYQLLTHVQTNISIKI